MYPHYVFEVTHQRCIKEWMLTYKWLLQLGHRSVVECQHYFLFHIWVLLEWIIVSICHVLYIFTFVYLKCKWEYCYWNVNKKNTDSYSTGISSSVFSKYLPQTWLWISGPLCLYCAERLYRCIRSNKPVTIIAVISHPSDVVEIQMVKENFKARPGQVN
jgi:hypothetical protein